MLKPSKSTILLLMAWAFFSCRAQTGQEPTTAPSESQEEEVGMAEEPIFPAADRMEAYRSELKGKRMAVVANQTSLVGDTHLVDTLLALGMDIAHVFAPEHGFRGMADAGAQISDETDAKTGLPIYSLYGKNKKPSSEQMEGLDLVLFDIQDVGVRCYTYLSTLHYIMEAAAESGVPVMVLDRPNPNGSYVDGPMMEEAQMSFVGMHPVPLVYGMTIGEYARMIQGEGWINAAENLHLDVVPCGGYTHDRTYELPVAPSPNLPNATSVALYPSLVLFEGTVVSVGRGTDAPFQIIGHPEYDGDGFGFTPTSGPGAKHPKLEGERCQGLSLEAYDAEERSLRLDWLLDFHAQISGGEEAFFLENLFFDKLAGNTRLREQISRGVPESDIRASWAESLESFKEVRDKYLMYP